ncbi:MAG: FAD-binding protein [Deltaproteobacteria bacterium]|nr:FAD-binding protein [Deltaproteobacteria bacterium]MBW2047962.1 FAD-binding protein [Deltaproteobacteria bacterium]MBW2111424.1 FAD-binding protein [Deltaproteobacteria bacterium]MBW2352923.1 FAD-binding protein [Deltaproteobacteria bacterium]HDZ91489.1 FAD-binding protein [Deltaproteobacteria bacterium]
MVSFSYDASEHSHRPACAVWPSDADQVAKILRLANSEKIPVIPRGAGTGLSGMAVPIKGGIILDLSHMNRIVKISIEDRLAVVKPGVVYVDLEKALEPFGFFFPPDPASGKVSTLGGNVATNAGGLKGAKYGTTRDYVLGLQVVLPDGRIMRTGSKAMKSVSGYDLTRLFVGSEGTLGVVTEITLKINPKPTATSTALATFDSLADAGNAINQIMHSGIIPSALEILGRETLAAINENTDLNLPEVDAMLLAETDGYTREETDYQIKKVIQVFEENNAREVKQARTDKEVEDLWAARKSAYAVLARIKTHFVLEDVTVPMTHIAELLKGVEEISRRHDIQIATFGHAGDGNLHPQILYDGYDQEQVRRMEAASADLFKLAIDLDGTLTGEHGIGLAKAPYMTLEHDPVAMDVMRHVKKMFDPNNILNPGKMGLEE